MKNFQWKHYTIDGNLLNSGVVSAVSVQGAARQITNQVGVWTETAWHDLTEGSMAGGRIKFKQPLSNCDFCDSNPSAVTEYVAFREE